MTRARALGLRARIRLLRLSTVRLGGRKFWILPLLPVLWPLASRFFLQVGLREEAFTVGEVLPSLIGLPMCVLGVGLGCRVIAAEIDQRTIEIAYTVPGGASRLWTYKLCGAALLLLAALLVSTLFVWLFVIDTPPILLLGAYLGAAFHLALAMWFSALFRSEVTGALVSVPFVLLSLMLHESAVSPLYDPVSVEVAGRAAASEILARTVQNRIGIALATAALVLLAFDRSERRERILG